MIESIPLAPTARVFLLSIPAEAELVALAARLPAGSVAGMGTAGAVHAAREICAHLDNTLFHYQDDAGIPWQDGYFDALIDPRAAEADASDCARVVAENGIIWTRADSPLAAGLPPGGWESHEAPQGWVAFRRPPASP